MKPSRLPARLAAACTALLIGLALRPEHLLAQGTSWGPTGDQGVQVVDSGRFEITSSGRKVGVERFQIRSSGDSLVAMVNLAQYHPGTGYSDTLLKRVRMVADAFDYGLRTYQSEQLFRGYHLSRGISVQDTSYTSFRQDSMGGEINGFTLPPGRVYVLDPPVFTNFDAVCLNLKNRVFQTRPITMLMVTPARDTVLTVMVTDLGKQTIQWAGRPVVARHLSLGDVRLHYDVWSASDGRMLRLEHTGTRLHVERAAPARRTARRSAARAHR